jgi:hypothetical protein
MHYVVVLTDDDFHDDKGEGVLNLMSIKKVHRKHNYDTVRQAIERGKEKAREWDKLDPETHIPTEAAKQIVLAALGVDAE